MFTAEFEQVDDDNRRRAPRAPVSLDAGIGKGARTLCKVEDISIRGARLKTYSALQKGTSIWLTLPGTDPIAADVAWADDYSAGCRFRQPLDIATFERLAALT